MFRTILKFALAWVVVFTGGCSDFPFGANKKGTPATVDCIPKIRQLEARLAGQRSQIEELNRRLMVLQGFSADRMQSLVYPVKVEFGRYTGGFDADKDGVDDGINIYLILRDRQGDRIKAGGAVNLELWDLAEVEGKRLLQKIHYEPAELWKCWRGGFLADHYKFQFKWDANNRPKHSKLTVKVTFTVVLTGKVFQLQKLVEVKVPVGPVGTLAG